MPAIAPFDGVGGRAQQAVVQEVQGLLQVGRLELTEDRPQSPKAADLSPQPGQFRQCRLGATPAVEKEGAVLQPVTAGAQITAAPAAAAPDTGPIRTEAGALGQMTIP